MQQSPNTSKWHDTLWAALIFFTRLPFWRLRQPPREAYAAVVEWWPVTGWLTGGLMAATLWASSMLMPYGIALLLAIIVRLLVTGVLHEDGLADFFDGFGGGGTNRERILAIMKDSHIGTYGVIALVAYFALLFAALLYIPSKLAPMAILAADPYARMVAALFILRLPYARTEDTAKNRTVYRKPSVTAMIRLAVQGLPLLAVFYILSAGTAPMAVGRWAMLAFAPLLVTLFLCRLMFSRIKGYTGDCCGAACLLAELTFYLCLAAAYGSHID